MNSSFLKYVGTTLLVSLWAPVWWAILLPGHWQDGQLFSHFYYTQHHLIYPMLLVWIGVIPLSVSGCLLAFKFKSAWAMFTVGAPLVGNWIFVSMVSSGGEPCSGGGDFSIGFTCGGLNWTVGNGIVLVVIMTVISLPALIHLCIASSSNNEDKHDDGANNGSKHGNRDRHNNRALFP